MKYGDTLWQRSCPDWRHNNIDYAVIKALIKEQTTESTAKPLSVPGTGGVAEQSFEDKLYNVFAEENARVNLFVKCKVGEIEARLDRLDKQLAKIAGFNNLTPGRKPSLRHARLRNLDNEALSIGQVVNSLSRYINAQKTAFRKLLKKYKKWTGSDRLEKRFRSTFTTVPDSFWKLEVEALFDQYTAILHMVRKAYQAAPSLNSQATNPQRSSSSRFSTQAHSFIENNDIVGFDSAFASSPLGPSGGFATYWVHPDSLVELQVLLLQHTRLATPPALIKTSPFGSGATSPALRRVNSDVWKDAISSTSKENDIGVLVLDDLQRFVGSSAGDTSGSVVGVAYRAESGVVADARWAYTGDAVVSASSDHGKTTRQTTRLNRKHLQRFLDTNRPFLEKSLSSSSLSGIGVASGPMDWAAVDQVRSLLEENNKIQTLAGICARRSRFAGMINNAKRGVWAIIDRDIAMKKNLAEDCSQTEWTTAARHDAMQFPFAVLQVRHDGLAADALVQLLDASHLTERVDGFSLEKHAIWECCKPDDQAPPSWLDLLRKDIRKLPEAQKRHSRRASNVAFQADATTSHPTSNTTGSVTDGYTSASTLAIATSSNTSIFEASDSQVTSPLKKEAKRLARRSRAGRQTQNNGAPETRYWSEYDHPEDGSESEGYYIYVTPNDGFPFPGVEAATTAYNKLKSLFDRRTRNDEESALLPRPAHGRTNPDDSDSDSTDDDAKDGLVPNYGSIRQPSRPSPAAALATRTPRMRSLARHDGLPGLSELIDSRDQEREQNRFRLYSTSLVASLVLLVVVMVLSTTGRKSQRPEVDAGMLFGIVTNLFFAFASVAYMMTRQDQLSWVHKGTVFGACAFVCIVDGMLVASMIT